MYSMLCFTLLHCFTVPFMNPLSLSNFASSVSSVLVSPWIRRSSVSALLGCLPDCGCGDQQPTRVATGCKQQRKVTKEQNLMFQGWCPFKIMGQLSSSHKLEDFASQPLSSSLCHGKSRLRLLLQFATSTCKILVFGLVPSGVLGPLFLQARHLPFSFICFMQCSF